MNESTRDRIRAAISDAYYDARNDGLTMEHAADQATAKVMSIIEPDPDLDECGCYTQASDPHIDPRCKAHSTPFLNIGEGEYGMGR